MNLGTDGPGTKNTGGDLLFRVFSLSAKVTFTMKQAILLSKTTMTAIWERIPAFFIPRILGLVRMGKSSFAEALVLSAADRSALSLRYLSVPRITSLMSLGNCRTDMCFVKPW